jgi:desulfoferrodoxin (superoxide reductase-like protein)
VRAAVVGVAGLPLWAGRSSAQPAPAPDPFARIHRAADPAHPTAEERERAAVVTLPARVRAQRPFEIGVAVGTPVRPGTAEDHVEWIEIRAGDARVARFELAHEGALPSVRLTMRLDAATTIRVLAMWNRHGLWETSRPVAV